MAAGRTDNDTLATSLSSSQTPSRCAGPRRRNERAKLNHRPRLAPRLPRSNPLRALGRNEGRSTAAPRGKKSRCSCAPSKLAKNTAHLQAAARSAGETVISPWRGMFDVMHIVERHETHSVAVTVDGPSGREFTVPVAMSSHPRRRRACRLMRSRTTNREVEVATATARKHEGSPLKHSGRRSRKNGRKKESASGRKRRGVAKVVLSGDTRMVSVMTHGDVAFEADPHRTYRVRAARG